MLWTRLCLCFFLFGGGSSSSDGIYEPKYGYLETRIQIADSTKDTHTAFWLQGPNMRNSDPADGTGNDRAEVDIFESAWFGDYTKAVVHIDGYDVDKTEFALRLIDQGGYFFLSRPRRFRKSLFLDTLKELFEGNQALFEGLYAAKRWDWSDKYPVIRISFGAGVLKTAEDLQAQLQRTLRLHEAQWGLDPDLKFVFLTGVSNFTKVSLFSGLNHLHDITILPEYSTPTFLLKLLSQRQVFLLELSHLQTDTALLGTFDVGNIPTEALMFQAGYLTIAEQTHAFGEYRYRLRYPNREVQQSLNSSLIRDWTPEARQSVMARSRLGELLLANDLDGMGEHLKGFYASLPNEWFMNLDSVVRGQKSEARSCLTTT